MSVASCMIDDQVCLIGGGGGSLRMELAFLETSGCPDLASCLSSSWITLSSFLTPLPMDSAMQNMMQQMGQQPQQAQQMDQPQVL